MTKREQEILKQLENTVAVEYRGTEYLVVGKSIDVEEMELMADEDEEVMPYIMVISPYSGADNLWVEWPIHLDELANDPNLKLYTLRELPFGD